MEQTRSSKARKVGASRFGELDQIVVQFFDAIRPEFAPKAVDDNWATEDLAEALEPDAIDDPAAEDATVEEQPEVSPKPDATETWPASSARPPSRGKPRLVSAGENVAADAMSSHVSPRDGCLGETDAASPLLLAPEEDEFITNTVAWLQSRPNSDILLEQVWNMLVAAQSGVSGAEAEGSELDDPGSESEAPDEPVAE